MTLREIAMYHTADEPTRREIEQYIEDITDPQTREMFRLHFVEGLSYAKTAVRLNPKMGRMCVFNRIHRYKRRKK